MFEWEIVIWFHVIVSIFSRSVCSTYSNFLNRPIQFFFPAQPVRPLCLLSHFSLWFHSALLNFFFLLSSSNLFLMNSEHGKNALYSCGDFPLMLPQQVAVVVHFSSRKSIWSKIGLWLLPIHHLLLIVHIQSDLVSLKANLGKWTQESRQCLEIYKTYESVLFNGSKTSV